MIIVIWMLFLHAMRLDNRQWRGRDAEEEVDENDETNTKKNKERITYACG